MPGVCLSVCLSVCFLLATLRKNYCTDLRENFTTKVSLDKEDHAKSWKSSGFGVRIWTPDSASGPDAPWRRYALSECSCLDCR